MCGLHHAWSRSMGVVAILPVVVNRGWSEGCSPGAGCCCGMFRREGAIVRCATLYNSNSPFETVLTSCGTRAQLNSESLLMSKCGGLWFSCRHTAETLWFNGRVSPWGSGAQSLDPAAIDVPDRADTHLAKLVSLGNRLVISRLAMPRLMLS